MNQLLSDKVTYLRKSIGFQIQFQKEAAAQARTQITPTGRISWSTLDDLAQAAATDEIMFMVDKLLGQFDSGQCDLLDAVIEINSYAMKRVLQGANASQGSSQGANMIRSYELQTAARLMQDSGRWVKHLMDNEDS